MVSGEIGPVFGSLTALCGTFVLGLARIHPHRRTPFASADFGVRPTGSKPVWVRRQSAPEVRASSQTKLSRGFVGPAHRRERLTALAADTSQTVSRCVHETGGEESSRRLMHSQSVVPCVGRARAREPHTRVPEEEGAMGCCTRFVPLGKGRQR